MTTEDDTAAALPPPIQFSLRPEDRLAFSRNASKSRLGPKVHGLLMAFAMSFPSLVVAAVFPGYGTAFFYGTWIGLGSLVLLGNWISRGESRFVLHPKGLFLCAQTATLGPRGLRTETAKSTGEIMWSGFLKVEDTATHLFLYTDSNAAVIVPKRAFEDPASAVAFVDYVRRRTSPQSPPN